MVSQEQITTWKEAHGKIYRAQVAGKDYYFHNMDREMYLDLQMKQAMNPTTFDNDIEVFKSCVVSDYDEAELKKNAGISAVISERVMVVSGFELTEIEEL